MGHEGYLTEVYRRYTHEDLAKFYKQGETSLLIFTEAGEVSKLRAEVEDRNKQLQTLVNGLTTENLQLKSDVTTLKQGMTKLDERMKRYEAFTQKFMEATPEELEEIGQEILKKRHYQDFEEANDPI